jgi:hypothetical protein
MGTIESKEYVKSLDLSGVPRGLTAQGPAPEASQPLEQDRSQGQVVGSGLLAYREGVAADARSAIADAALLAQLVANKRVDAAKDPLGWFREYLGVLQNVGWTVRDLAWSDYAAQGSASEVSEKILELLPVVLGPAPAALAIMTVALKQLRAMNPDSSWITIFRRESERANIARFAVGVVESGDAAGEMKISLLASLIEAHKAITQVLFFKFKDEHASFKATAMNISVAATTLTELAPTIHTKIRAYQLDYLGSIKDL